MTKQAHLTARDRRAQILTAGLPVAEKKGYTRVTRDDLAEAAGVPPSLVSYHLGTMADVRRHLMREAIRAECLPVIAQGLAMGDARAKKAPEDLRRRAVTLLIPN